MDETLPNGRRPFGQYSRQVLYISSAIPGFRTIWWFPSTVQGPGRVRQGSAERVSRRWHNGEVRFGSLKTVSISPMYLEGSTKRSMQQTELPSKETVPCMDRRRHHRYRWSAPIRIRCSDGTSMRGISIEISRSGMSAITCESLKLNETVEIESIDGMWLAAVVRRNVGRVHGFEFVKLTTEETQRIVDSCQMLAVYQTSSLGI